MCILISGGLFCYDFGRLTPVRRMWLCAILQTQLRHGSGHQDLGMLRFELKTFAAALAVDR